MNGNVKGLDELIRKYQALGRDAVPVLTRAVRRQAEVVRGAAVKLCPRNKGTAGGSLVQSIHTMTKAEDGAIIGEVYTNERHAVYVEFGTGPMGAASHEGVAPIPVSYKTEGWWYPLYHEPDSSKSGHKVPERPGMHFTNKEGVEFVSTFGQAAQPFMYPALKQNEGRVMEGIADYFRSQLQKYCNGGAS